MSDYRMESCASYAAREWVSSLTKGAVKDPVFFQSWSSDPGAVEVSSHNSDMCEKCFGRMSLPTHFAGQLLPLKLQWFSFAGDKSLASRKSEIKYSLILIS